jgi:pimeloyl-ACP methyl ester carboxylesterase
MVHTADFTVTTDEHRLAATLVAPEAGVPPDVITLHGLGPTASRHTVRYLLDDLTRHGHGSCCFEFSGNGDSTGVLTESSLRRRRAEALAAARALDPARPPVVIGTSMGAHLAAWLVPELRPRGLVLFCPAAYPAHATDQRFDAGFARPGNHPDAPAFAGIRDFRGDLLIVAAREDRVVPADVVDGYLDNAVDARSREVIWLDGCDHFVHRWLPSRPQTRDRVFDAMLRVVTADQARI